jgi:hypothetical protein
VHRNRSSNGLGSYTRKITTDSPEAQKYFDQGLNFLFGFNHAAAIRAFRAAETADPDCAMAHWGVALACGPHINFPLLPPPMAELAWKELALAQEHAAQASAVEQALIEALGHRYAYPQPEHRGPLDQTYADALRTVWKEYPDDPDVGALFAESMMDLRPWDQWIREGRPEPGTDEILATLDAVLKLDLNHLFANHLFQVMPDAHSRTDSQFCPGAIPRQHSGDECSPPHGLRAQNEVARRLITEISLADGF